MTSDAPDASAASIEELSSRDDETRMAPVSGVPSDNATIQELMERLDELGYGGQFTPVDANHLECSLCGSSVRTTTLEVALARRMEGASDPDDMATLYAARCPVCHRGGTVVLGYGVNASELDGDISRQLHGLAPG